MILERFVEFEPILGGSVSCYLLELAVKIRDVVVPHLVANLRYC